VKAAKQHEAAKELRVLEANQQAAAEGLDRRQPINMQQQKNLSVVPNKPATTLELQRGQLIKILLLKNHRIVS